MLTLTQHEERGDYDDVIQVGGVGPASYDTQDHRRVLVTVTTPPAKG
jgi:hypothetical protein